MAVDTIIGRGPLSGGTVTGDLTMAAGTRILFDNLEGSAALPAIAFADAGGVYDTGIYQGETNVLNLALAGQLSYQFRQVSFVIQQGIGLAFDLGSGNGDAFIEIDAANILALSNGTNAQTWRIYETFTNVGNNQGLSIDAGVTVANTITITPFENGSGSNDQGLTLNPLGTGDLVLDGLKWPQADGAANELLETNGAGQLAFVASAANPVWVAVAFNAGDFTGNDSMTWTVEEADVNNLTYTISGKVMTVSFFINTTTVGGTPSGDLQILIPASKTATKFMVNAIFATDNGTDIIAWCLVSAAGTLISCRQVANATWAASTNVTTIRGQITFEID